MLLGTLPWLALTMLPQPGTEERVSLVPFADLMWLAQGPAGFFLVQVVGNLLVFSALGFLLPVRFASLGSVPRVVGVAAAGSLAIELTQLVSIAGRTFSVDDIMLNAAGAGLAALCSRRWWVSDRARPGSGQEAAER